MGFFAMLELGGPLGAQAGPPLTIVNDLPSSSVCAQGNTVSVFAPDQQVIQPGGSSLQVSGDFSSLPGVGIQGEQLVLDVDLPARAEGDPQNPDNYGGQFAISDQCVLQCQPAWYGKGIPTYVIATVTAEKIGEGCKITIARNGYRTP